MSRGRGLINEKGVTWRCAAHQPRFAPFHLRFHPLLRRSFEFSFCSPSFSLTLFCFVIPMLHLLCQRNRALAPLPFLFLSLHAPFRLEIDWYFYFNLRCSLEFSHYRAFPRLRSTTLFLPSYFLSLWFRGCKRFPQIPPRRVVHSRLSVY